MDREIKAVGFDLDGTLCESRQPVQEHTLNAISELFRDYNIFFSTGGGIKLATEQIIKPIQAYLKKYPGLFYKGFYLFCNQGASHYFFNAVSTFELYKDPLTEDQKSKIFKIIDLIKEKEDIDKDNTKLVEDRDSQINFSLLGINAPVDEKKKFDPDMSYRKQIVSEYNHLLPDKVKMYIGGTTSIDFVHTHITKGTALAKWMDKFGYNKNDVIYFGDRLEEGGNDYSVKPFCKTVAVTDKSDTIQKILDEELI